MSENQTNEIRRIQGPGLAQYILVQRVPALHAFWDLEKASYMKFLLVGLYCGPLLALIPKLQNVLVGSALLEIALCRD